MISAWLRGASKISRPTAGRWRRNRPSASFMVILESHVAETRIPAKAAKMGKRFDIGFLDGVLGFALVAQNAARDPVQAAVVPLHDGAERRVVPVKGPPDEFGIGGLGGDIWRGRYSHEGLPFTRLDAAAGERFPDRPVIAAVSLHFQPPVVIQRTAASMRPLHSVRGATDKQMCDAFVRVCQVKAVLLDVAQASVHVDATLRFIREHVERLERRPRCVALWKIVACFIGGKAEYASGTSENVNEHTASPFRLLNGVFSLYSM